MGLASFAVAAGFLLVPIANAGGVVQWDIQKKNHARAKVGKRATSTFTEVIDYIDDIGGYFATCTIGTPGQEVTLQLDTGSSDVWVPSSSAQVCEEDDCSLGTFESSNSTTFEVVKEDEFDISYVDETYAKGDYFTDTFVIGGANVSNLTMGLGINTTIPYGLVGVGFTTGEAIVGTEFSYAAKYANLPAAMSDQGLIATNAYSLWLNDLDANTGSVLFGGIDTKKYTGNLTRININPNSLGVYDRFSVNLTSLHATSSSGTDELTSTQFPIKGILDSGTTVTYVPTDLAEEVWKEAGAVYNPDLELPLIPCSMVDSDGYFSFGFAGPNGPKINVAMDELIFDLNNDVGLSQTFSSGDYEGQEACEFGIQNDTGSDYYFGDTFLRSAYVVYDLQNYQIAMAPTNFNATDSNIVAFASKGALIPSATLASNQSQATATSTFTQPAYAAKDGFTQGLKDLKDSKSLKESKDSGSTTVSPSGLGHLAVVGVTMLVSLFGGGLFLVG
ncbi:hypothetical protein SLS53_005452 [Cytospora paraplurivora]|uniref:Probable aspartic-type endopeptidase OPSB n=1 Tax=Cytospora paraplurivora TaxID=2898453 RepID=A0AAN9YEY5_9PEZI